MTPHGPDAVSTKKAEEAPLAPVRYSDAALAFMFESTYIFKVTPHAMAHNLQPEYYECWQTIPDSFDPSKK
jgi:homogentisate 1,2-dioxygenase